MLSSALSTSLSLFLLQFGIQRLQRKCTRVQSQTRNRRIANNNNNNRRKCYGTHRRLSTSPTSLTAVAVVVVVNVVALGTIEPPLAMGSGATTAATIDRVAIVVVVDTTGSSDVSSSRVSRANSDAIRSGKNDANEN